MRTSVDAADEALARMGYKSELPRNLSMLSVLGLSFAIMAAPYGLSTTLYITLDDGLSVTIIWGWVFVTLISIAIAASLAEICAVFPTAGMAVSGETADYVSKADSGNVMHRRFCPACGTPLFSAAEARPHVVIVRAGALDEPELARPKAAIWTASAPSWGHVDPDLPAFEGPPPP